MTEIVRVGRRSGRPRSEDADRAIIEATLDLLAESGLVTTTIEGIAARAGVGKSTIYRRWKGLESLICDAILALKWSLPTLPGTSVRDDLLALAEASASRPEWARNRKVHACFIGEMTRHPALDAQYREAVVEPGRQLTRAVLLSGIERGELRDDLDLEVMADIVTAPAMHWMLHNPGRMLTRRQLRQFLDGVLNGLIKR